MQPSPNKAMYGSTVEPLAILAKENRADPQVCFMIYQRSYSQCCFVCVQNLLTHMHTINANDQ